MRRLAFALLTALLPTAIVFGGTADGGWLKKVPQREHDKTGPYHDQPDAIAAGRRIFVDHCAQCHGENAEGTKRPALKTERVQQQATEEPWLVQKKTIRKSAHGTGLIEGSSVAVSVPK